jgi:glycosyltransferase involved in cell wall biosynthesis|tara:strand:- start:25332 stop:26456 length:1125 start_codon:yes stop_codon:yes gene_type:complete
LKKNNKKIIFLLKDLNRGGAEVFITDLANYLSKKDYIIEILTISEENEFKKEISSDINVNSLKEKKIGRSFFKLYKHLKSNDYNLIIANVWPVTIIANIASILISDLYCLNIEHGILSKEFSRRSRLFHFLQKTSIKIFYNLIFGSIAVSEGVREDLISFGVSKNKTHVINNSYRNLSIYEEKETGLKDWYEHKGIKLISVANLKTEKNISNLLKSISLIKNQNNSIDIKLLIAGDGPLKSNLKLESKELGIESEVFFAGIIKNPFIYLDIADLFVLSSDFEGFGIVIIEAMSLGKTIVSTESEGPSEILKKGQLGYLCKINDPEDLAKKILMALKNPIDEEKLKIESKKYSLDIIGNKYEEIIKRINLRNKIN